MQKQFVCFKVCYHLYQGQVMRFTGVFLTNNHIYTGRVYVTHLRQTLKAHSQLMIIANNIFVFLNFVTHYYVEREYLDITFYAGTFVRGKF